MCSLCGVLGGRGHWSERASHPGIFAGIEQRHTAHRERQDRTRLVNAILRPYGLVLADWAATTYVLRSHTGRTAMVANLSELWAAAERLSNRTCDPLDESLLDALASEPRA